MNRGSVLGFTLPALHPSFFYLSDWGARWSRLKWSGNYHQPISCAAQKARTLRKSIKGKALFHKCLLIKRYSHDTTIVVYYTISWTIIPLNCWVFVTYFFMFVRLSHRFARCAGGRELGKVRKRMTKMCKKNKLQKLI